MLIRVTTIQVCDPPALAVRWAGATGDAREIDDSIIKKIAQAICTINNVS